MRYGLEACSAEYTEIVNSIISCSVQLAHIGLYIRIQHAMTTGNPGPKA